MTGLVPTAEAALPSKAYVSLLFIGVRKPNVTKRTKPKPDPVSDMAAQLKCSLKKCIQGELLPSMARVEVRAFDISPEETGHMEVAWREDGEAVFHDICWKAMLDSFKIDNPFALSPREKDLILEAKKTAEYFDSWEKVVAEGARIAQILKTSQYPIAFTGERGSTLYL